MPPIDYDFSGWATRNNLKCSDGRIIMSGAFKKNDGEKVPLVWNHQHNDVLNILGHAILENKNDGVYAYCKFNDTESGIAAKLLVEHGDVSALSIYANGLKQQGGNVIHGSIKEVSLVVSGANPGAYIDSVIVHGEISDEEAIIFTDEDIELKHSNEEDNMKNLKVQNVENEAEAKTEENETIQDVFDTLTEKQKNAVYLIMSQLMDEDDEDDEDYEDEEYMEEEEVKHNVFENEKDRENTLSHSEMEAIFTDVKRYGSLKDSVLAHGITNIEYLFPDAVNVNSTPGFIKRKDDWVSKVLEGVHHTPFSRIKSIFANLTEDDARAKGYIKGKQKTDEVFSLLKRTTIPQTIYKKQKLERDDVLDITDFDVVGWMKGEMRLMLDEEIARAVLVGDGRLNSSDDKIKEDNIRPIWTDADLYSIKELMTVTTTTSVNEKVKEFIKAAIKSRKNYKGSGSPTLFTTEDVLTDCLLLEDTTGRVIYDTLEKLTTALRVKEIVTVPSMEGLKRTVDGKERNLMGIIVNLNDYNIGADKGGSVNMFEDFDIDYNAQKYLIETRCSGALITPYSAIVIETVTA